VQRVHDVGEVERAKKEIIKAISCAAPIFLSRGQTYLFFGASFFLVVLVLFRLQTCFFVFLLWQKHIMFFLCSCSGKSIWKTKEKGLGSKRKRTEGETQKARCK